MVSKRMKIRDRREKVSGMERYLKASGSGIVIWKGKEKGGDGNKTFLLHTCRRN